MQDRTSYSAFRAIGEWPTEVLRIVDANLNRSAEALRVVEDLCRFFWDLPGFAGELRQTRHRLLGLFIGTPADRVALMGPRDIEGDVGRDAAPLAGEIPAVPPAMLAIRNLGRLKESLRSLEEACRAADPSRARAVEAVRYGIYSLEKGILGLCDRGTGRLDRVRLYLCWSPSATAGPAEEILAAALEGGVGAVQLRDKGRSDREMLGHGRRARELCAAAQAVFIVNDRPDLARVLGADGVHLGQDDMPVAAARRIVGPQALIGVSTHSIEQAREAVRQGADYVGVGPVFPSPTKEAGPCLGPETLRGILTEVAVPAFAIGGIHADTISVVLAAGACRVAVSAAVQRCLDGTAARAAAAGLLAAIEAAARGRRA